jgi:hypothetical protein
MSPAETDPATPVTPDPTCVICNRRPADLSIKVQRGAWVAMRPNSWQEPWCSPCAEAVIAKYPGKQIWPPYGVWLLPQEVPA